MSISNAPVLVAVDGTWGSTGAICYAADEAHRDGRALVVAHVAPAVVPLLPVLPMSEDEISSVGRQTLDEAIAVVQRRRPDVEVCPALRTGSRVRHLLELARTSSLVVVGRDLAVPVERVLTGSVSTRVAGRSPRPCVVVPADWKPRTEGGPPVVVVGVKAAAHADALFAEAFLSAASTGSALRVVHVVHVPDAYAEKIRQSSGSQEWLAEVRAQFETLVAPWRTRYPQVELVIDVLAGTPVRELMRAARDADLLVIGRTGRSLSLGSTAHALVLSAPAPVAVVPPGEVEDDADLVLEKAGDLVR